MPPGTSTPTSRPYSMRSTRSSASSASTTRCSAASAPVASSPAWPPAYLAGTGRQERLAGLFLAVTVLDSARAGTASRPGRPARGRGGESGSKRRGYLDGRALAEMFAWLRPRRPDLELLGQQLPVGQEAAGLRHPVLELRHHPHDGRAARRLRRHVHRRPAGRAGCADVLGVPIDLGRITVDTYVVAGIADHITPWENCYRTTQLVGGSTRFILSTSGHIAALVNPPGNPKAGYQVNKDTPADPLRGSGTPRPARAAGGRICHRGSPSGAAGTGRRPSSSAGAVSGPSQRRPGPTSSTAESPKGGT